jgi:hypothetical protein
MATLLRAPWSHGLGRRPELCVVFVCAVIARMWKVDAAGVTMDEATSWYGHGRTLFSAIYNAGISANNHVLNSIAILTADKLLGGWYGHALRLPSLLCGIIYSASVILLCCKLVRSRVVAFATATAAVMSASVFDLSLLARGYAFALAALFAAMAYLVSKERLTTWSLRACLIAANIVAVGAMLSSIWVMTAFNVAAVALYSPERGPRPWLRQLAVIAFISGVGLSIVYTGIGYEMVARGRHYSLLPAAELARGVLEMVSGPSMALGLTFVCATGILLLWEIPSLSSFEREEKLVLGCCGLTLALLVLHQPILGLSIGTVRNQVFLVPLAYLVFGILATRAPRDVSAYASLLLAAIVASTIPSLKVVETVPGSRMQSMSAALARHLRARDPGRVWNIGVTPATEFLVMPIAYYAGHGYNLEVLSRSRHPDLVIHALGTSPIGARLLDPDLFGRFGCDVQLASP